MNESQLERYAAQLEEDQADRDLSGAWQRVQNSFTGDLHAEYEFTSLMGYLNASISVTASMS